MRKITVVTAILALIVIGGVVSAQASDHYILKKDIVKVACSTTTGNVIGADTTVGVGLLTSPCSTSGDKCVACLDYLISNSCGFNSALPPVATPTAAGNAVVYHLFGTCASGLLP